MTTILERLAPVIDNSPGYRAKAPFDELTELTIRPPLYSAAYVRAWLIAVAADTNLEILGLSDDDLPPMVSAEKVRRLLNRPAPRRRNRPPPIGGGPLTIVV
jgi:hypothetical protein